MQVILSDGDLSTLGNMKSNLELNQLNAETLMPQKAFYNLNWVSNSYLLIEFWLHCRSMRGYLLLWWANR